MMTLLYPIPCVDKIVFAFGWAESIEQASDAFPSCCMGSFGGLSHQVFELGEDLFDGVQVWAVGWQE